MITVAFLLPVCRDIWLTVVEYSIRWHVNCTQVSNAKAYTRKRVGLKSIPAMKCGSIVHISSFLYLVWRSAPPNVVTRQITF